MRVPKRIIDRVSRKLEQELAVYRAALAPPHQWLFAPLVLAVLKASSCYVSEAARELEEELGGSIGAREERLLHFLHSPKFHSAAVKEAHRKRLRKELKRSGEVRIYADLSDLSKPYARKMRALDTVRDGSDPDKRKRPGYWLSQVYAVTSEGALLPVVVEPFSTKEEGFLSQNALILDAMEYVYEATGGRGTWISDRGYDDRKFFDRLLDRERSFVIRLRLSEKTARILLDAHRRRRRAGTLARKTDLSHPFSAFRGHKKSRGRFGWQTVYLPDRDEPLTLVVFSNPQDQPVALLTNRLCRNASHALCIIDDYLGRWHGAEDPLRFLKQQFRLEKFLVDGMDAIRAWFFLILVAFSLLFTLRRGREILRWILRYAQPFDKEVRFTYYRIFRGFSRLVGAVPFHFPSACPLPRPP